MSDPIHTLGIKLNKNVFWLYMLKKWSYRLLNIIFEKSFFRDQIHMLGAKLNNFPHFWLKKKKKNQDFALKIVFWLYMFKKGSYKLLNIIFEKPSIGDQILILVQNSTKTCFLTKKWRTKCGFLHWKSFFGSTCLRKGRMDF